MHQKMLDLFHGLIGQNPHQTFRSLAIGFGNDRACRVEPGFDQVELQRLGDTLHQVRLILRQFPDRSRRPSIPCCAEIEQRAVLVEQNTVNPH